jgi:hypothetical protein
MTAPTGFTLIRDEVVELAHLLGVVEDWLLHTDEIVLDDLKSFLHATGPQRVSQFIDDLGDAGVTLARLLRANTSGDAP